eukprot:COSAG05_NODE_400_length_10261_cov_477.765499_4_plen_91_part_00
MTAKKVYTLVRIPYTCPKRGTMSYYIHSISSTLERTKSTDWLKIPLAQLCYQISWQRLHLPLCLIINQRKPLSAFIIGGHPVRKAAVNLS